MGNTSSPPLQDRIIRIRELEQRGRNPRDSRQWKISVSCGTYYAVVNLVDPFIASEEASLRWALEEHPTHHPFKLYKSRTVSKELWRYSVSLMDQLNLHEVLTYPYPEDAMSRRSFAGHGIKSGIEAGSPIMRGRRWYVDIEGCFEGAAESIIHGLHWEALENPEIWPNRMRPCLIVRRKVPSNDILTHGPIIAIRAQSFRILLVVSHSSSQAAPTQMGGGRVANPRLVARPLADIVGQLTNGMIGATAPIQLEIVRPGTWKSLQEHLGRRGKGYFHLIHFDVHGRVTHDKANKRDLVSLAFLSDHSARKRSWRPAAEVSALLSTYGVKLVVLNASRSAKAFGACEANIAETLIRDGVRAVIAFPYKVLNTGIEVFMSTFYRCLLTRSWDFAVALSGARRAMMKSRLREGRFGIKVLVEDWVVPILYNSGGTKVSVVGDDIGGDTTKSDSKGIFSKFHGLLQVNISDSKPSVGGMGDQRQRKLMPKGITPPGELVGRDGDIFRMETMLDTSVLRVVGSPGVGKSTLILHLCWWWKATSLVEDSFYFDCYEKPHLNVEMIKRQLYLFLFFPNPDCSNTQKSVRNRSPIRGALLQHWSRSRPPSPVQGGAEIFPDDWAQRTLDKLRQTPYLIVLDSLESSDASVKHNERLKGEINEFLESLKEGRTVVLVVSNKQECWLNDSIVKFKTYHLKRLDISHAIEFAARVVEKYGGDCMRFRGAENQMYIRKLVKLVEMNPLVMNLTLPNIAIYDDSPQTIFTSLLQGAIPLGISDAPHTIKVMRNMTDLLERLDKDSKQLLFCLAPFWKRIPKDIDPYIHSLLYHKALPSTAEVVQQFSVSRNPSEWERQRAKSVISSTGLLLRYGYIIRDLLSLELLSESDIPDPFSTLPQYYHVHPLLTLSLRRVIEKDQESPNPMITNYSTVTLAFLDYYTQQSARWVDNPNETYDLAAQEIQDDEINFLSAISIPLQFDNPDKLFDIFPLHIYSRFASMALVNRELASNAPLIAHFSELILQRFNELRARRGDSNVRKIAMEIAMFASYWLCEYYSENSPTSKFRVQIERSTQLMALANNISPNWQESLAILEEQATRQKSAAVSDGMTDGLRLRKPWSGLMISEVSRETSVIWEAKCDLDDIWLGLAMAFSRLKSIAIQVPLAARFSPALGEQLRKDLRLIWEDCIDSVTGTDLEPFLSSYEWVTILLERAPIRPNEGLSVEETPHIPSSRFLGYPEFVRSQLMLQLRDTASAKRYLLDGLQRARNKSNFSAEILLRIRLCDLTFELRNWNECIEHLEWIRKTMVQLGENITTADFSAYSRATWRKGICQIHLHQWDAAIEAFDEASGVCRHIHDHITEYAILRKLAAIKRESGLGEMTVAEALLKALTISYDPAFAHEPAIVGERGVLLQRITGAMVKQKAGESAQSVIARLACARDTTEKEMHEFIDELITREKELTADDIRMGIPLHRTEKNITKLYAEAEMIMFDPPRIIAKKQLRWFVGSKWERGLLTKRDSL